MSDKFEVYSVVAEIRVVVRKGDGAPVYEKDELLPIQTTLAGGRTSGVLTVVTQLVKVVD